MRARQGRLVCVLLLFVWSAPFARDARPMLEQGLLFEVSRASGAPSYVLGTIHSSDERVLALSDEVTGAIARSSNLVLEVIPDPKAIAQSMRTMYYADGRTLEQVIGAELYAEAVVAAAERGLDNEAIARFKPWAIVMLFSVPADATGDMLDIRLYQNARRAGKRVTGLETFAEQLDTFDGLSESDQVALLRDTLADRSELPAMFEQLIGLYLEHDLAGLERVANDNLLQQGEIGERLRQRLIDDRNRRMLERLIPLLDAGPCFVAVGALHLPGQQGMLQGLREAGYQLRVLE